MRLGLTTWSMVTVRAEEAIPLLASVGFDSVEIAVVPGWRDGLDLLTPARRRRIKQLLQEYQLALPAIAGNADILTGNADELAENWRTLTGTVDLAAEWTTGQRRPAVDTYVGGRPGEWEPKRALLTERLGRLCDYAAERGVPDAWYHPSFLALGSQYRSAGRSCQAAAAPRERVLLSVPGAFGGLVRRRILGFGEVRRGGRNPTRRGGSA